MPLTSGSTRKVVSLNISELTRAGKPHKQAIAIALDKAGKSRRNRKRKRKEKTY